MTLLPLLVHITMMAAADCYLEHALPVGLCFLLGPSPGVLAAHGQGWVLSPPPFKSAAPKMTCILLLSSKPSKRAAFTQMGTICKATLGTNPAGKTPLLPRYLSHLQVLQCRKECQGQSNAHTASVRGKWPPGFLQAAGEGKPSRSAGGDGSCNAERWHRESSAAGPKDHRDGYPTLSS